MNKLYMGIDIGSISTKGVIIDEYNNIITSSYLYTEGSPVNAVKRLVGELKRQINLKEKNLITNRNTSKTELVDEQELVLCDLMGIFDRIIHSSKGE